MKAFWEKVKRLLGYGVLALGLVEKFVLGLIKKLKAVGNSAQSALDRASDICNDISDTL
jgi:hypothetical protein